VGGCGWIREGRKSLEGRAVIPSFGDQQSLKSELSGGWGHWDESGPERSKSGMRTEADRSMERSD
jgi:hypothetical protein